MHKASMKSINAEANVHSTDWVMHAFANEFRPRPMYAVNKVNVCSSAKGLWKGV